MNILCYGDSNTYGLTTDWKGRLPRDVRWPGRLQMLLGADHYVLEDGLIGRTCAIPDYHRYGRSAMDFLPVALEDLLRVHPREHQGLLDAVICIFAAVMTTFTGSLTVSRSTYMRGSW